MKKTEKLQEKMKVIQFKYKNDPEKLNQEMMALYKNEKINPFSGCLSAIVQIVLLLSIFYLVKSPLTYMKKIDSNIIDKYYNILKKEGIVTDSAYKEIDIVREISKLENYNVESEETNIEESNEEENNITTDIEENNDENIDEEMAVDLIEKDETEDSNNNYNINQEEIDEIKINMDFLGIDLSKVPTQSGNDWKVYIIPVLYVILSFISMRIATMQIGSKKKKEAQEENPMIQANKQMSYIFPILYLTVTLFAPLGLALYWLVNSVLMIIEKLILNVIFKEKKDEEDTIKYIEDKKEEE